MNIGFDADQDCSGVADNAVAAGATFVCRYLKNLMLMESVALSMAGLKIVSVFETKAERALAGASAGTEDGARALSQAVLLGQPTGSAIYATADFGENAPDDQTVLAYFVAFKAALIGQYKLGVYGEGAVCKLVLDAGVADYTWVSGGRLMRGTQAFLASGRMTLVQDVGDKAGLNLGIDIDSDTAYSDDYGGWSLPQGVAA